MRIGEAEVEAEMIRLMRETDKLGMSSCCHPSGGGAAHSAERPVTTHTFHPYSLASQQTARGKVLTTHVSS